MNIFKPQTSNDNRLFYKKILNGDLNNYVWGKNKRFSPEKALTSESIKKYFEPCLRRNLSHGDKVLDIGCGSGMFLPAVSKMCKEIVGIDISFDMIEECNSFSNNLKLTNYSLLNASAEEVPFCSGTFDLVYMVDVLHHVEWPEKTLLEVYRILKTGGKCIIFEPNKYNLLLMLLCFLDRNEWGALRLGSKRQYKKIIPKNFHIEEISYNGLIIGPDGKLNLKISNFLNLPFIKNILGWQSPKLYICLIKV